MRSNKKTSVSATSPSPPAPSTGAYLDFQLRDLSPPYGDIRDRVPRMGWKHDRQHIRNQVHMGQRMKPFRLKNGTCWYA